MTKSWKDFQESLPLPHKVPQDGSNPVPGNCIVVSTFLFTTIVRNNKLNTWVHPMVALHLLKSHLPTRMWELGSKGGQLDLAVAFLWGWIHGHKVNFPREHIKVVPQPIEAPRIKAQVLKCNTEFSKFLQRHSRKKDHSDAATEMAVGIAAKREPRDDENVKLEASGQLLRLGRPAGTLRSKIRCGKNH